MRKSLLFSSRLVKSKKVQGWGGRVYFCELEPRENEIKSSNPMWGVEGEWWRQWLWLQRALIGSELRRRQGHTVRATGKVQVERQRHRWVET